MAFLRVNLLLTINGLFTRLSYLHSQKIVHRDVKTENMLLDKSRTIKIADFGVARVEASNPNDMTGETGTLGYMAPEVCTKSSYSQIPILILFLFKYIIFIYVKTRRHST